MTYSEISKLFTDSLKKKLVDKNNIADIKVEVKEESECVGDFMTVEHDEIEIKIRYFTSTGKLGKWKDFYLSYSDDLG